MEREMEKIGSLEVGVEFEGRKVFQKVDMNLYGAELTLPELEIMTLSIVRRAWLAVRREG